MTRTATFSKGINEALHEALKADERVICYGLGVPDPKGVFGTTLDLQERFGEERVFDMPASENGMTGVAVGAALTGLRPVVTHQRLDFFLLAMDQLVNNAAKWHYMFGAHASVPITIRLIIGRGWGQGPTHSQNLQSWFAHVPGLKVVMPTLPGDAKGLLLESIFDNNPVVFLEHRWLHNQEGDVPEGDHRVPLGEAAVLREGDDVTIVSMSYMTVEALRAADFLEEHGVHAEVIDLRTVSPMDWNTIERSVRKTGRLLAVDTGCANVSVSSEIIARAASGAWDALQGAPRQMALPNVPTPTSQALTKHFYHRAEDIVVTVGEMLGKDLPADDLAARHAGPHDVPGDWFKGPF